MLFSRKFDIRQPTKPLKKEEMTEKLQTAMWNAFWESQVRSSIAGPSRFIGEYAIEESQQYFWRSFYSEVMEKKLSSMPYKLQDFMNEVYAWFHEEWWHPYELMQFMMDRYDWYPQSMQDSFVISVNEGLQKYGAHWRFIANELQPITSDAEIAAVENALSNNSSGLKIAQRHLIAASHLLSEKTQDKQLDSYRNVIKESFQAIESVIGKILEKKRKSRIVTT